MRFENIRLLKGFAAFIIATAVLFVGQVSWQKYAIYQPLNSALNNVKEVEKAEFTSNKKIGAATEITITLKNINNLQKTYKEIDTSIKKALESKAYRLYIKDSRSEELEDIYYEVELYVQKAIIDGDFPLLMDKVNEISKVKGAIGKAYVDDNNVYIQISKADKSLYELVPRHTDRIGGN